jgi:15-cis-phytoene synthase
MTDSVVAQSEVAIAQGSKSFAAAAKIFDRNTRQDAVMLYAWCRHCDDVIDGQTLGHDQQSDFAEGQRARLDDLKRRAREALSGKQIADPNFEALRRVVERHNIPLRHLNEFLAGFEMDVNGRTYQTMSDILEYCYGVAGVVGVMMAMIMGARDPKVIDRASDLGLAFQLTNIARDVIEDARVGRVYVPRDVLVRHGITTVDANDPTQWPKLHAAALELLDLADQYYASAYVGIGALPARSAWAIAAARRVYRDIGKKLRASGPAAWENRVSTSKGRKYALLVLSFFDVVASRFNTRDLPRDGLWQRPTG